MNYHFCLSKEGAPRTILLSVSLDKKKKNISTPLTIKESDWDELNQMPVNIYLKEQKIINRKLNEIRIFLEELENSGKIEEAFADEFSNIVGQICFRESPQVDSESFLQVMLQYIESRKKLISKATYLRYFVFLRLFERFEGFKRKHLKIRDIDSDFLGDFLQFGRAEKYTISTVNRTINFFKTVLNYAERKGYSTAVRELEIRRAVNPNPPVTLSEKEIAQIERTVVPKDLIAARDWLIISCYTGQRVSDFMNFEIGQFVDINGMECLGFVQKKTGKPVLLPLHPAVKKVLKRNGGVFPKPLSVKVYNEQIKRIAQIAQIREQVSTRKRVGYRSVQVQTEKWEVLASHTGRRSFATNFYGRIPTALLIQATGHSSEQIFMRYLNPDTRAHAVSLGNYFNQLDKEGV